MNCIVWGSSGSYSARGGMLASLSLCFNVSPPWKPLKREVLISPTPVVRSAGSSRPAGSPQPPCTQHESRRRIQPHASERRAWFKIAPLPPPHSITGSNGKYLFSGFPRSEVVSVSPLPPTTIRHQLNSSSWTHTHTCHASKPRRRVHEVSAFERRWDTYSCV